jgi:hypothetical protein
MVQNARLNAAFADFGALYKVKNVVKKQIFCTKNHLK